METSRLKSAVIFSSIMLIVFFTACNKDEKAEGIDLDLYNLAIQSEGYTWYKYSETLLNSSRPASGHSPAYLRTRYNAEAVTQFDSVGKIKNGIVFPNGSVIVKELWGSKSSLDIYAVLLKDSTNANADANGWVWGYLNSDGTVKESSSNKGSSCIDCHKQENHVDYTLMNKYFK